MTPKELSALYDIKKTLERIKSYCINRTLDYDENHARWMHVASEAGYGLIKVKDIERGAK